MPWRAKSPIEERLELFREYESGLLTMTDLAAQYGISRKTGYKWLERYMVEGPHGLDDRSRRPHHHPQATDPEVLEALLAHRYRHPRWGAKKLLAIAARRRPHVDWPSRSTVNTRLKQRGLIHPRRRRHRPASGPVPQAPLAVNEVWTDFKRSFALGTAGIVTR